MAEKGSDLIFDVCCAFCEDDKINREATVYCKQCSKGICDECVKYHNKLFKTHTTCGREDKKMWPVAKTTLEALMFCEQHPDHRIELFCEDHSKLCCHLCHFHEHRQCRKVNLIDVKAKEMCKKRKFHKVASKLESEQQTIQREIDTINMCLQAFQTSHEKAHEDIKIMRKKIDAILDTLERNNVQSLNTLHEALHTSLQSHLSSCFKAKEDLKQMKDAIKDIDAEKHDLSFVAYAKSREFVSKAQVMLKAISELNYTAVEFRANADIEKMLSSLSGLGDVMSIETKHERKTSEILKCTNKALYNMRIAQDENECNIAGICELSSGYMLILDYNNKRVKMLDKQYKVIAHTDLSLTPWGICSISPSEVAVAIYGEDDDDDVDSDDDDDGNDDDYECTNSVQFFIVNDRQIVKDRVLKFKHPCGGIAYFNGSLFITSWTALYQYTLDGELVKKIYEDTSDTVTVAMCAVSAYGSRLYVTDFNHHKLLTLSMDGTVLSSLEDPALRGPTCVHVSETGQLLVCGHKSNNVFQVGVEGGMVTLASKEDGLDRPESVYYSARTGRLFVGKESSDILVIDTQ